MVRCRWSWKAPSPGYAGARKALAVVSAYEKRIAMLERNKVALAEKCKSTGQRQGTFEELFELAMQFLASPSFALHDMPSNGPGSAPR